MIDLRIAPLRSRNPDVLTLPHSVLRARNVRVYPILIDLRIAPLRSRNPDVLALPHSVLRARNVLTDKSLQHTVQAQCCRLFRS